MAVLSVACRKNLSTQNCRCSSPEMQFGSCVCTPSLLMSRNRTVINWLSYFKCRDGAQCAVHLQRESPCLAFHMLDLNLQTTQILLCKGLFRNPFRHSQQEVTRDSYCNHPGNRVYTDSRKFHGRQMRNFTSAHPSKRKSVAILAANPSSKALQLHNFQDVRKQGPLFTLL